MTASAGGASHEQKIGSSSAAKPVPRDVSKAISYIRANLHRAISARELASVVGVAERTLRMHFRTFLGMTSAEYSVRIRLAQARQSLRLRPQKLSVTDIAHDCGFLHLGRFSSLYCKAFGETPSATHRGVLRSATLGSNSAFRGSRPEVTICRFVSTDALSNLAEAIGYQIATMISSEVMVSMGARRDQTTTSYVIRGNVLRSGDKLRVVIAMVNESSGAHLWGDAWDGRFLEAFSLVDRVAKDVAQSILSNIHRAEIARVARKHPADLDAYELCLRARSLLAATTSATAREALDLLYRAMERDPDYALASGLAAWGHAQLILQNGSSSPKTDNAQAQKLCIRAAALDPDDAIVLTARAMVATMNGDGEAGMDLIERALARDPRLPWAWERKGWLKLYAGEAKAAIPCFGRALRLDTTAASKATRLIGIGAAYFDVAEYHQSTNWMLRALQAEPGVVWVNRSLAVSYSRIGESGLAQRSLEELKRYRPDITVSDVISSLCFSSDFKARMANSLDDLGLAP